MEPHSSPQLMTLAGLCIISSRSSDCDRQHRAILAPSGKQILRRLEGDDKRNQGKHAAQTLRRPAFVKHADRRERGEPECQFIARLRRIPPTASDTPPRSR